MTGIESYIKKMSKRSLLTKQQEIELAKRIEKGDDRAKHAMVESNLRLAFSIAKKYARNSNDLEDLIQEANIGLIKAVERYDWRKGFKFSTYACWWIKQSATKHITNNNSILKIPAHLMGYARKVYQARKEFNETFQQEPTPEELSDILSIPLKDVKEAIRVITAKNTVSIDKTFSDENTRSMLDIIPDTAALPDATMEIEELKQEIVKSFKKLTKREEIVLRLRFGITELPTEEEDKFELKGEK